jgi:hypothetical protein
MQHFLRDELRCDTGKVVFVDPQLGRLRRRLRVRKPEVIAEEGSRAR